MELTDRELAKRWWERLMNNNTNENSKGYWVKRFLPLRMWKTLSEDEIFWIWNKKAGEQ